MTPLTRQPRLSSPGVTNPCRQEARTMTHKQPTIVVTLLCTLAFGCGGSLEIEIPEPAMQAAMDEALPIEFEAETDSGKSVRLVATGADILLAPGDDRVGIELEITVDLPEGPALNTVSGLPHPPLPALAPRGQEPNADDVAPVPPAQHVEGSVLCRVGIRYEPTSATIYCQRVTIDNVDLGDLPSTTLPIVKQAVAAGLNQLLDETPVYKLDGDETGMNLARAVLKSVAIRDGHLVLALGP